MEYTLRDVLRIEETIHVLIEYRSQGDGVIGTRYHGKMRERIPIERKSLERRIPHKIVQECSTVAMNALRGTRMNLIANPNMSPVTAVDYEVAVRSTETSKPKHHAYNFLLTRVFVMNPGCSSKGD